MEWRISEAAATLALLRNKPRGTSWNEIALGIISTGSAANLLADTGDTLLPDPALQALFDDALSEVQGWVRQGHKFVTLVDHEYPSQLRDTKDAPPLLFYQGDLRTHDEGVCIVGSRNVSSWGLKVASEAARLAVDMGLTVVSGLASGIDTAAHRSALAVGGRTVAVIGTGIDRSYPAANKELQAQIATEGLVITQFLPGSAPTQQSFPMRNVTMSGYGLCTVVVEASERSGTRIQARAALQHGRAVALSEKVATTTKWGADMAERSNTFVFSSPQDLEGALNKVREQQAGLLRVLSLRITG